MTYHVLTATQADTEIHATIQDAKGRTCEIEMYRDNSMRAVRGQLWVLANAQRDLGKLPLARLVQEHVA